METTPYPQGTVIGEKYVITRCIGRGASAAVYAADDERLERQVALKIFQPPPFPEEAERFLKRFQAEGKTLASLDHPHIVTVFDCGETPENEPYLAMEFIDGPSVGDLVAGQPLSIERTLHLATQACKALSYAHQRGIVHRDLKPSNLMIRHGDHGVDHIKLVDFGLVQHVQSDQSFSRDKRIVGSPHCMAPEQILGLNLDHRADLYALGNILFFMLTGHYPFERESSMLTMMAHTKEAVPSMSTVNPEADVPADLEAIVRRCLQRDADARFSSADEIQRALQSKGPANKGPLRLASVPAQQLLREKSFATSSMVALVLATVALIGFSVFWTLTHPSSVGTLGKQQPDIPAATR